MNLGPPTNRKKPEPLKEQWKPVEGKPHLEQNNDNPPKLRTKQPLPPLALPVIYDGFYEDWLAL